MQFFKLILTGLLLIFINCGVSYGQVPTFSGFWLTPQLTAPTAMAGSDAYQVSAHYRSQAIKDNIGYRTMLLSGRLPLYDRSGTHFGTAGLSLMRDESGSSYLYTTSGVMLTYLYDASIAQRQHLVGGVQAGYYGRKIDWSKVTTNSQFVNGGFDPAADPGESFSGDPSQTFLANVGLAYYLTDFQGEQVFHLGAAIKNANGGSYNYLTESKSQAVPTAMTAYANLRLISNPTFMVVSDLFWQNRRNVNELRGGVQLRKGTSMRANIPDNHLGIGLYYAKDNTGTIALQFIQPNYLLGLSYDLAFGESPLPRIQNAVEVTLGWRAVRSDKNYPGQKRRSLPWKNKRKLPWQGR